MGYIDGAQSAAINWIIKLHCIISIRAYKTALGTLKGVI